MIGFSKLTDSLVQLTEFILYPKKSSTFRRSLYLHRKSKLMQKRAETVPGAGPGATIDPQAPIAAGTS